jgi:1,4-dihydroxy-2-naphthoate polyprenyltransferase
MHDHSCDTKTKYSTTVTFDNNNNLCLSRHHISFIHHLVDSDSNKARSILINKSIAASTMVRVNKDKPSRIKIFLTAARPHTLTASLSPCLVAWAATRPPLSDWLLWTCFCVLIQLTTNLHNDYSDYVKGADTPTRLGQARVTAKGWWTPRQTLTVSLACASLALTSGLALLYHTDQLYNPVAASIIVSSIFNAFAYTGVPGIQASIAYSGLADVFCLAYFGLVATTMPAYLLECQGFAVDWSAQYIYGTCIGCLATNIMVVNNIRDRFEDAQSGKRTTCVRFGKQFSLYQYYAFNVIAYFLVAFQAWRTGVWILAWPCMTMPLAWIESKAISTTEGSALNQHVGKTAGVQFLYCILLSLALYKAHK